MMVSDMLAVRLKSTCRFAHSLAVGKVAIFSSDVVEVAAVLVAVVKVELFLEVVVVIEAVFREVVDIKVAFLDV